MRRVSLREANQNFARYVAAAEAGERIVLTRRGKAVAEIVPADESAIQARKQAAYRRLLARLERGLDLGGVRFTRDELHDR